MADKFATNVILPFFLGGFIIAGANAVAYYLSNPFLAGIIASIPAEIITIAFLEGSNESRSPYTLATVLTGVVFTITMSIVYGVSRADAVLKLTTLQNRMALMFLGLTLWAGLSVSGYYIFRKYSAAGG